MSSHSGRTVKKRTGKRSLESQSASRLSSTGTDQRPQTPCPGPSGQPLVEYPTRSEVLQQQSAFERQSVSSSKSLLVSPYPLSKWSERPSLQAAPSLPALEGTIAATVSKRSERSLREPSLRSPLVLSPEVPLQEGTMASVSTLASRRNGHHSTSGRPSWSTISTLRVEDFDSQDEFTPVNIFGHGCFQRMVLFCSVLSLVVLQCHSLAFTMIARKVGYWCKPPHDFANLSVADWKKLGIPQESDGTYSRCMVYDNPYEVNRTQVACSAWDYDTTSRTIISTWNLVCDREWLLSVATVVYMLGAAVAVPAMGLAADQVGRRPITCIAVAVLLVAGFGSCFASGFLLFVCARCVVSGCASTIFITIFIVLFEDTSIEHRPLYGTIAVSLGVAISSLGFILLYLLDVEWRVYQLIFMAVTSLLVSTFYLIDESPRWLLSTGKFKRAERAVLWAARVNNQPLERVRRRFEKLKTEILKREPPTRVTPRYILASPILRARCGAMYTCWFAVMFSYYGLQFLNIVKQQPWAFIADTVTPGPLNVIAYLAMNRLGRRTVLIVLLSVMGGSCAALIPAFREGPLLVSNILLVLARGAASTSVMVNYIYTAELFPTILRSVGICGAYMCGRLGASLASALMISKGVVEPNAGLALIGFLVLLSELVLLQLPETLTRPLENTAQELDKGDYKKHLQETLQDHIFTKSSPRGPRSRKSSQAFIGSRALKGQRSVALN